MPASVRVTSSDGPDHTIAVRRWIDVPTAYPPGFQTGFSTGYTDPVQQRNHLDSLIAQFPSLMMAGTNLPLMTNGYQRKAQAIVGVSSGPGALPDAPSRRW